MYRETLKTASGKEEVLAGDESGREGGLRMLLPGVWGTAGGSSEHGVVGRESYADMFPPVVVWSLCYGEEKPKLVRVQSGHRDLDQSGTGETRHGSTEILPAGRALRSRRCASCAVGRQESGQSAPTRICLEPLASGAMFPGIGESGSGV